MAKTFREHVDKFERNARLANKSQRRKEVRRGEWLELDDEDDVEVLSLIPASQLRELDVA
jgi:hypothetical protein